MLDGAPPCDTSRMTARPTTVFAVIVYGKSIAGSSTMTSLVDKVRDVSSAQIVVWNNGPAAWSHDELARQLDYPANSQIDVFETTSNWPLSWIYNRLIQTYRAQKWVILDDDTQVTDEFVRFVVHSDAYLSVPVLRGKAGIESPQLDGRFSPPPYAADAKVLAAGTGLCISAAAADHVSARFGSVFDEHFALYGVDTSLLHRLRSIGKCNEIALAPELEHSFSRLEKEGEGPSEVRSRERGYELGLRLRHYFSFYALRRAFSALLFRGTGRSKEKVRPIIYALLTGRHPRCGRERSDSDITRLVIG